MTTSIPRERLGRAGLILVALFALPAYECGDIISDPGFDLWCGDKLCNWEIEAGQIERVPTWHDSDHGVSLVGDDVRLSQLAGDDRPLASCIQLEFLADIAQNAQVFVEIDADDDGTVEFSQQMPTSDWALLQYIAEIPEPFDSLRFRIRKQGPGRAVLAEIEAIASESCVGDATGQ